MARAGRRAVEIKRCVVARKVAPALEGPIRAWLHELDLAIENDAAAADAVLVGERLDAQNALAAEHPASDHPKERAPLEQPLPPLRNHAGPMKAFPRLARFLFPGELLLDPVLQVLNGVATDAKFDEMQGHYSPFGSIVRILAPSATCAPTCVETSLTIPSAGASSACSIFIASTTATRSPLVTFAPAETKTASTLPCIGALTVPSPSR